jgi:hypothetical protein
MLNQADRICFAYLCQPAFGDKIVRKVQPERNHTSCDLTLDRQETKESTLHRKRSW